MINYKCYSCEKYCLCKTCVIEICHRVCNPFNFSSFSGYSNCYRYKDWVTKMIGK